VDDKDAFEYAHSLVGSDASDYEYEDAYSCDH